MMLGSSSLLLRKVLSDYTILASLIRHRAYLDVWRDERDPFKWLTLWVASLIAFATVVFIGHPQRFYEHSTVQTLESIDSPREKS